ncbi:hypothetical protein BC628DRAFT_1055214 [Trametes gibbosa]|nr:hypothetical protein BC628DRAFT_1055214 [Trametes gibbosa]
MAPWPTEHINHRGPVIRQWRLIPYKREYNTGTARFPRSLVLHPRLCAFDSDHVRNMSSTRSPRRTCQQASDTPRFVAGLSACNAELLSVSPARSLPPRIRGPDLVLLFENSWIGRTAGRHEARGSRSFSAGLQALDQTEGLCALDLPSLPPHNNTAGCEPATLQLVTNPTTS